MYVTLIRHPLTFPYVVYDPLQIAQFISRPVQIHSLTALIVRHVAWRSVDLVSRGTGPDHCETRIGSSRNLASYLRPATSPRPLAIGLERYIPSQSHRKETPSRSDFRLVSAHPAEKITSALLSATGLQPEYVLHMYCTTCLPLICTGRILNFQSILPSKRISPLYRSVPVTRASNEELVKRAPIIH